MPVAEPVELGRGPTDETITMVGPADKTVAEKTDEESPPWQTPLRTRHGTVLGTPAFMSPEQARGERLTAATDLYSFGLILYQLFTGTDPTAAELSGPQVSSRAASQPSGSQFDTSSPPTALQTVWGQDGCQSTDRPTSDCRSDGTADGPRGSPSSRTSKRPTGSLDQTRG